MNDTFTSRTAILLGEEGLARLQQVRVILFGVGGVGSWAAESLVRTGLVHLTIVDCDVVVESNLNRQLMALHSTLGQPKVEALRNRLLDINPEADIAAVQQLYTRDTASQFPLDEYDYVLDCIDSLAHKAELILRATASRATLLSSMGAALKIDPTRVRVSEFWQVDGCPLAATLRKRFRRAKQFPQKKFQVVYSDEVLRQFGQEGELGSLPHITALFGFTLAGLLVQSVVGRTKG